MKIYFSTLFLIIVLSGLVFADKVLAADFTIDKKDNVYVKEIQIIDSIETRFENEGPYSLRLLDKDGNVLSSLDFNVGFILYDAPGKVEDSGGFYKIKYDSRAETLLITHNNKTIYSEAIGNKFCNKNNKCDNNENIISCPSDCTAASKDNFCVKKSDGICDPDCTVFQDSDCPKDKKCVDAICFESLEEKSAGLEQFTIPLIVVICLIILVFLALFIWGLKRK